MTGKTLLLALMLCASSNASAEALQLVISGKAFHQGSGAEDLNEKNHGYGLQYEFEERNRWSTWPR